MINITERKKALEAILLKKLDIFKQIEAQRNQLTTEIIQLQGKIDLLKELAHESSEVEEEKQKIDE